MCTVQMFCSALRLVPVDLARLRSEVLLGPEAAVRDALRSEASDAMSCVVASIS